MGRPSARGCPWGWPGLRPASASRSPFLPARRPRRRPATGSARVPRASSEGRNSLPARRPAARPRWAPRRSGRACGRRHSWSTTKGGRRPSVAGASPCRRPRPGFHRRRRRRRRPRPHRDRRRRCGRTPPRPGRLVRLAEQGRRAASRPCRRHPRAGIPAASPAAPPARPAALPARERLRRSFARPARTRPARMRERPRWRRSAPPRSGARPRSRTSAAPRARRPACGPGRLRWPGEDLRSRARGRQSAPPVPGVSRPRRASDHSGGSTSARR